MKTTTKKRYRLNKRVLIQRLMGLAMLLISYIIIRVAMTGITVVDRDATAVLITIPLGLYLLFSKEIVVDL